MQRSVHFALASGRADRVEDQRIGGGHGPISSFFSLLRSACPALRLFTAACAQNSSSWRSANSELPGTDQLVSRKSAGLKIPAGVGATLCGAGPDDPMTETIRATLPREPNCGSVARHLLPDRLADQLEPTVLGDAQTVLSELVNNAYVHGTGRSSCRSSYSRPAADRGDRRGPRRGDPGPSSRVAEGGGHGLQIVQSLSNAWGVFEGTTHVWAELETAREDPAQLPL